MESQPLLNSNGTAGRSRKWLLLSLMLLGFLSLFVFVSKASADGANRRTFPETFSCSANGVYVEEGMEIYVVGGGDGDDGTFETTYRFIAHFPSEAECNAFTNQIRGRCLHPIAAGTGTGDYEGVTGMFQMTDNVEEGTADLVGLLHFFDNTR